MIKLFRNIRKSLLAEGKTTKYLVYATGEIILVVIGILIALQINNWNSENQVKKLELYSSENGLTILIVLTKKKRSRQKSQTEWVLRRGFLTQRFDFLAAI